MEDPLDLLFPSAPPQSLGSKSMREPRLKKGS